MASSKSLRMYFSSQRPDGAWEAGRQIYPVAETPRTWDEMRLRDKQARQRNIVPDVIARSIIDYADAPSGPGDRTGDYWIVTPPNGSTIEAEPLQIDKRPLDLDDLQAQYRALGEALQQHFQRTGLTIFVH